MVAKYDRVVTVGDVRCWCGGMTAPIIRTVREPFGVAVAGFGWMGRVHTQAYARVLHHFPQLTIAPRLAVVADEVPGRADEAAAQYGFAAATRDWRDIAADPNVRAVSIAAPELPAPGDRRRDGAGRQTHLDREARRTDHG